MAKVFIVNDSNRDFDKAKRFGELVYATTGNVPIFKTDVSKKMLQEGLKDFDISKDYLLLAGPVLLNVMATMLVAKPEKPLITLVFDAKAMDYTVRHLSF